MRPAPFRLDTPEKGAGGIQRWSHLYMLLPRLGFFIGEEKRVPYDIHLPLGCAAPRPVCAISPQLDRSSTLEDVSLAVEAARHVYALHNAENHLGQPTPEAYNHFGPEMQALVIHWLNDHAKR